jgi:hypothetical protein
VSLESGGQKRGPRQDLCDFAEPIYRSYECFEPGTLFLPQGSLFFSSAAFLGVL